MSSDAPASLPLKRPRERPRVRVVAPSSPFPKERLERGVRRLEAAGFVVDDTSRLLVGGHAYLNGSDAARVAALEEALASDADIVWLARGGYGLTRLLSSLSLPAAPLPVVVGFSDATALSAHLFARGARSVHGPLATTLADEPDASFDHLVKLLAGQGAGLSLAGLRPLSVPAPQGEVEGSLFAANLCVLTHLIGTRSLPPLAGALLLLEEVGERPYRIDRMLTQLLESGALDGVRGVVLGHLTGCDEPGAKEGAPSPEEVFIERLAPRGVPVVAGALVGHQAPNFAVPNGARGRLGWGGREAQLTFVEELFPAAPARLERAT